MEIQALKLGVFAANCYLIKKQGHVLMIDPGARMEKVMAHLEESEIVDAIVLTHGHFDHIGAVDGLQARLHCPVYLNLKDEKLARDARLNSLGKFSAAIQCPLQALEGPAMTIGIFELELIEAPGHTAGSTLIKIEDALFTGDVLFKGGIGRCDLYSGSESAMRRSLKLFKTMDPSLTVYPGHDESTGLGEELLKNPYLQNL